MLKFWGMVNFRGYVQGGYACSEIQKKKKYFSNFKMSLHIFRGVEHNFLENSKIVPPSNRVHRRYLFIFNFALVLARTSFSHIAFTHLLSDVINLLCASSVFFFVFSSSFSFSLFLFFFFFYGDISDFLVISCLFYFF